MQFKIKKNGNRISYLSILANDSEEVDTALNLLSIAQEEEDGEISEGPSIPLSDVAEIARILHSYPTSLSGICATHMDAKEKDEYKRKQVARIIVRACHGPGRKITGIKILRNFLNLGLKEAKDLYETC